jgi:hypothetical protein
MFQYPEPEVFAETLANIYEAPFGGQLCGAFRMRDATMSKLAGRSKLRHSFWNTLCKTALKRHGLSVLRHQGWVVVLNVCTDTCIREARFLDVFKYRPRPHRPRSITRVRAI